MNRENGDVDRLGVESIATWKEDDGPDGEKIVAGVKKKLDELERRLSGVPDALRPIFAKRE